MVRTKALWAAVFALLPLSAAADTLCTRQTFAGNWVASDFVGMCNLTVAPRGAIRGTCIETVRYYDHRPDRISRFNVRGTAFVNPDCSVRLRITGQEGASVLRGRIWGTAGSTPDAGVMSTPLGREHATFTLYRR